MTRGDMIRRMEQLGVFLERTAGAIRADIVSRGAHATPVLHHWADLMVSYTMLLEDLEREEHQETADLEREMREAGGF